MLPCWTPGAAPGRGHGPGKGWQAGARKDGGALPRRGGRGGRGGSVRPWGAGNPTPPRAGRGAPTGTPMPVLAPVVPGGGGRPWALTPLLENTRLPTRGPRAGAALLLSQHRRAVPHAGALAARLCHGTLQLLELSTGNERGTELALSGNPTGWGLSFPLEPSGSAGLTHARPREPFVPACRLGREPHVHK